MKRIKDRVWKMLPWSFGKADSCADIELIEDVSVPAPR